MPPHINDRSLSRELHPRTTPTRPERVSSGTLSSIPPDLTQPASRVPDRIESLAADGEPVEDNLDHLLEERRYYFSSNLSLNHLKPLVSTHVDAARQSCFCLFDFYIVCFCFCLCLFVLFSISAGTNQSLKLDPTS